MVGNLWEWTEDCDEGDCGRRVLRGGSWHYLAELQRPGARNWSRAGDRHDFLGFRDASGSCGGATRRVSHSTTRWSSAVVGQETKGSAPLTGLQSPRLSDPGQLVIASRGLLSPMGSLASPTHRETIASCLRMRSWVKTQRVHHSLADRVQVVVEHPWRNEHSSAFPVDRHPVQSLQRDGVQHVALRPRFLRTELSRDRSRVHPVMKRLDPIRNSSAQRDDGARAW